MITPERKAALARVEEAIKALRATEPDDITDQGEFLRSWVVVAAYTRDDGDGGTSTGCSLYVPETSSTYEAMGLLKAGTLLEEMDFVGGGSEPS